MRRAYNGNYRVTRPFGVYDPAYSNYPGSRHPGTDYGLPANTQLVAGMTGKVTGVFDRPASLKTGRGKEVVIAFGNKERKACHMNRIDVSVGQQVVEGQAIGLSGYTGYVVDAQGNIGTPGGAHLHDELLVDGQYVNLEDNLKEEDVPMPTDADITKVLRAAYKNPTYQPTGEEFRRYKQADWGWPKLTEDLIASLYPTNNDITNALRKATGNPEYNPTADELARYKKLDWGWPKLFSDVVSVVGGGSELVPVAGVEYNDKQVFVKN